MTDLFLRAETPASLRAVVKSAPFRSVIGDLTDPEDAASLRMIAGAVDHKYFPPRSVVVTPGAYDAEGNEITPPVTDPWCWYHIRLSGKAEANDFEEGPGPDRIDRSKVVKWVKKNGVTRTIRGCQVFEYTLGNGKRVQVWRPRDMAANGVLFHEFAGGGRF